MPPSIAAIIVSLTAGAVATSAVASSLSAQVLVTPTSTSATAMHDTTNSENFTIKNTGTVDTAFIVRLTCSRSASNCRLADGVPHDTLDTIQVAHGASTTERAWFEPGSSTTSFTVKLIATEKLPSTATDTGVYTITSGSPSQVVVTSDTNGVSQHHGLCLTVAVGAGTGSASECGDLRLVHALPAVRTYDVTRAPVLLYNSQNARPNTLVAFKLQLPASTVPPDSFRVKLYLKRYGGTGWTDSVIHVVDGHKWSAGNTRRVVMEVVNPSDSTGFYTYELDATSIYDHEVSGAATTATGHFAIVDRSHSRFQPGWWVAGVETLIKISGDSALLWIGGDGSTALYLKQGATSTYTTTALTRPDYLTDSAAFFFRWLPHKARVQFALQSGSSTVYHSVVTQTRSKRRTIFTWGVDTLLKIKLPPDTVNLVYTFGYTAGRLTTVTAPPNGGTARVDTLKWSTDSLQLSIIDPDHSRLIYTIDSLSTRRVVRVRNKLGVTLYLTYDKGQKLSEARYDSTADSIATFFTPLETNGILASASFNFDTLAVAQSTLINGPRGAVNGVDDTTRVWLGPYGRITKVRNALGATTVLGYTGSFPALATTMLAPDGRYVTATYDTHGNILTSTDTTWYDGTTKAVTRFAWDTVVDEIDSITTPLGRLTTFGYDDASGARLWIHTGHDTTSKHTVTFGYDATTWNVRTITRFGATAVSGTPGMATDSLTYDGTLANLAMEISARGYWVLHNRDAIGREWCTIYPVINTTRATSCTAGLPDTLIKDSVAYDIMDRPTYQGHRGETGTGHAFTEGTEVRLTYDSGGRVLRHSTTPTPNAAAVEAGTPADSVGVDSIIHVFTYDRANRVTVDSLQSLLGYGAVGSDRSTYDAAGNLVSFSGNTKVFTATYDILNRLTLRAGDSLTYDSVGRLIKANNTYARITRTYLSGGGRLGAVAADTERVAATVDTTNFTSHVYGLRYNYDLEGRRVGLLHPSQLIPHAADTLQVFAYDTLWGDLDSVTDIQHRVFRYDYDDGGRLSLERSFTTSIPSQAWRYDVDGRAVVARGDSIVYDFRSKSGGSFTVTGILKGTYRISDGLGNIQENSSYKTPTGPTFFRYEKQTGRLRMSINHPSGFSDTTLYGFGGMNQISTNHYHWYYHKANCGLGQVCKDSSEVTHDRVYYDPMGRVIETQYEIDTVPGPTYPGGHFLSTYVPYTRTDVYRYDALGRRIWSRFTPDSRCPYNEPDTGCLSWIQRNVWDGDQLLWEIRAPGDSLAGSDMEVDNTSGSKWYGRVGYTHGLGIDKPLDLFRVGNGDTVVVTHQNGRGAIISGYCPISNCTLAGDDILFPMTSWGSEQGDPSPMNDKTWFGGLLGGLQDPNGLRYMRNRYYDASTGRFTQADPIGLAGGLNDFGFAGGDPANYADPTGLCYGVKDAPTAPCLMIAIILAEGDGGIWGYRAVGSVIMRMAGGKNAIGNADAVLRIISNPRIFAAYCNKVCMAAIWYPLTQSRNAEVLDHGHHVVEEMFSENQFHQAAQAAEELYTGVIHDTTHGATHFFQGRLPSWGKADEIKHPTNYKGNNIFFGPKGTNSPDEYRVQW